MILFKRKTLLKIYLASQIMDIPGLDIAFKIKSHRRRTPNKAEFTVFNLAKQKRDLIQQEASYLEFFTGYGEGPLGRIFKGFTDFSQSEKNEDNTEWLTKITAIDAGADKEYTTANVNKTFETGTVVRDIFQQFADSLGLPATVDFIQGDVLLSSETYMGPLRDALDDLCRDYDYSWSIQFGVLEVVKKGYAPIKNSVALSLSPDNIVETPSPTRRGIQLKTLILPYLIPSRIILIPPDVGINLGGKKDKKLLGQKSVAGTYIVDSVDYSGERDGSDFYATSNLWRQL